jgi:hypothetical protein
VRKNIDKFKNKEDYYTLVKDLDSLSWTTITLKFKFLGREYELDVQAQDIHKVLIDTLWNKYAEEYQIIRAVIEFITRI